MDSVMRNFTITGSGAILDARGFGSCTLDGTGIGSGIPVHAAQVRAGSTWSIHLVLPGRDWGVPRLSSNG